MKKTMFVLGAATAVMGYALYQKYSDVMMKDMKKAVNKMSNKANNVIDDMM